MLILGYERVDIEIMKTSGLKGMLQLQQVAYWLAFTVNIVSGSLLWKKGC